MGVRATDNFNRADVDPLAGNWSDFHGHAAIVSNQLWPGQSTGSSSDEYIIWNADTPPADHYTKITFIHSANAGSDQDDGGPCVRLTTGGNGYLFNIQSFDQAGPDSGWEIFRLAAGVGTTLASGTLFGTLGIRQLTSGDVLECRVVGSLISGYLNGVFVGSATDTTYPSGGSYGVHISDSNFGATRGFIFDNFEGGDFSGGASVQSPRRGTGPGMGPSGRRRQAQQFPSDFPAAVSVEPIRIPFSLLSKTGFPRRRALAQRYPDSVVSVAIVNETTGQYTWLGTNSPLSKEIVSVVGAYTWSGKTSPLSIEIVTTAGNWTWAGKVSSISKSIIALKGSWTWAGTSSPLSKSIASLSGNWTWAGKTSTFGGVTTIIEGIGSYSWSGPHSDVIRLVSENLGTYSWVGVHSTVGTGGAGSTIVFYDGLSVADGLTYHKGLSRPTILLTPAGGGTFTVLKVGSVSDEIADRLSKETILIDGDLP